jgi:glycosyltransferase involved in cell wall biosynthesis
MRIGINCLSLSPSFVGGLNTFVQGLLTGFAGVAQQHHFRLYATTGNQQLFESLREKKNFEIVALEERTIATKKNLCRASLVLANDNLFKSMSDRLFRDVRRMMDQDNDILYTPSVVLQSFDSRIPTVLSMHDIQHLHYPQFFSRPRRLSRRITYGLSAKYANFFQASSEFIKTDLLAHFGSISPEQISVIPEGVRVEDFAKSSNSSSLNRRYALPEKFLLYPAQLWPHKNHLVLLRALKHIETEHGLRIPLILTGGKYTAASTVLGYIAQQSMDYVYYLGKIPFEDLVGLYQRAAFLVMPSLHESNSLPILEAAAAGTPIIASRIPPNEELARVLDLNLFDPLDSEQLERVLLPLWEDGSAAASQVIKNRERVRLYSWENAAKQYLRLFADILKDDLNGQNGHAKH